MKQAEFHGKAGGWDGLYVDVQASFERKLREMGDRVRGISWFSSRAHEFVENLPERKAA
jgi:hypothetical protein